MHSINRKSNFQKLKEANGKLVQTLLTNGLNPTWYIVIHFNDACTSKRQQQRRIDMDSVTADCAAIKNALYTEVYGAKWKKRRTRSKCLFSIEYGASKVKPHLNIVLEDLPVPFDDHKSVDILFNYLLPARVKCLWRKSANVQKVDHSTVHRLNQYICKESCTDNSTIIYTQSDF